MRRQFTNHVSGHGAAIGRVRPSACFLSTFRTMYQLAFDHDFYPCDAMLARVLATASCPSVTSWCSIKTDERTTRVFGMEACFDKSYTVYYKKTVVSTKISSAV